MSNRLSKGTIRAGSLALDSTGGVAYDAAQATSKIKVISFTGPGAATGTEQDSTWDLPSKAVVTDVWARITAASTAGGTLDVGILSSSSGGDADGFLDGVSTTGTVIVCGQVTVSTSGGSGFYYMASNTLGAYLSSFTAGTTGGSDPGIFATKDFLSDSITAKSVSWNVTSTGTTVAGKIYIVYTELA